MLKNLISIVAIIMFTLPARAQKFVTGAQVKQILINSSTWGLGGGSNCSLKVIYEAGKWNSYLVDSSAYEMAVPNPKHAKAQPKFIIAVNARSVNELLNGIAVIKPLVTPGTFNITPDGLIAELTNNAKQPIKELPDLKMLINQKVIDIAVDKAIKPQNWLDAMLYCEVDVISQQNDTLKMSTRTICPTKLPWLLNGKPTYDMAINNFVVAAMGALELPNKSSIDISSLKESIFNYVDQTNKDAPIATFKWKNYYPQNLASLTSHFAITERFMQGNTYQFSAKTPTMPANAQIDGWVDMSNKQDVAALISYGALIDQYFKKPNFTLKYYSNRPGAHIAFGFYSGRSPYYSLKYLHKKLPALAKIDSTRTITVTATEPDDASTWLIIPDNKALLTYHSVTTPHGETAVIYPAMDPKVDWSTRSRTWYLFNADGKVLSHGLGL